MITGDGPRISAAACRVDKIAKRLRKNGDERTLINPEIPLPGHFSIFDHIDWTQALAPAGPQLPQHTWATTQANQKQRAATMTTRDPGPPPF